MKKEYVHVPLQTTEGTRVEVADHRFYRHPHTGVLLPSVTTVLKEMNKELLDNWKKDVGQKKAKEMADYGAARGNDVHELIEEHIQNNPTAFEDIKKRYSSMPAIPRLFKQIRQVCDGHVDNIRLQEAFLFSESCGTAGSVDLVADWKNKLAIIDFKTATSIKKEDTILAYKYQTALYALMFMEMYNIPVETAVLIIGCEKTPVAQVFEVNLSDYFSPAIRLAKYFYRKNADFIVNVNKKYGESA